MRGGPADEAAESESESDGEDEGLNGYFAETGIEAQLAKVQGQALLFLHATQCRACMLVHRAVWWSTHWTQVCHQDLHHANRIDDLENSIL